MLKIPSDFVTEVVGRGSGNEYQMYSHRAHDVVVTMNQRQWRSFNVATTSCAQWVTSGSWMGNRLVSDNSKYFYCYKSAGIDFSRLYAHCKG